MKFKTEKLYNENKLLIDKFINFVNDIISKEGIKHKIKYWKSIYNHKEVVKDNKNDSNGDCDNDDYNPFAANNEDEDDVGRSRY